MPIWLVRSPGRLTGILTGPSAGRTSRRLWAVAVCSRWQAAPEGEAGLPHGALTVLSPSVALFTFSNMLKGRIRVCHAFTVRPDNQVVHWDARQPSPSKHSVIPSCA